MSSRCNDCGVPFVQGEKENQGFPCFECQDSLCVNCSRKCSNCTMYHCKGHFGSEGKCRTCSGVGKTVEEVGDYPKKEKEQEYQLRKDDDGHWYLVEKERAEEFDKILRILGALGRCRGYETPKHFAMYRELERFTRIDHPFDLVFRVVEGR